MTNQEARFLGELTSICTLLGDAVLESDDGGDRWIDIRRGKMWGQIRSTYSRDTPVWEIAIGTGVVTKVTTHVGRKNG